MSKPTSATPKPLSDDEQAGTKRVIRKALIGTGLVTTFDRLCAEIEINALQAQPAPVPLAEDEALIAEISRTLGLTDQNTWSFATSKAEFLLILERLSLRSGQLAQVLALCDERDLASAESRKYGGAFCYAQVLTTDEIRNLLTTEEQER